MSLRRLRQFGIKLEGTEGTAETLAAADYSINTKGTIEYTAENPPYERERGRATLSKDAVLKAARYLGIKCMAEFAGGSASASSTIHAAIAACGFRMTQLKVVDIGTISGGTFVPGQTIGNHATFASATKTGILIAIIDASPDKAVYLPLTGAFTDSETLYNYADPQVSAPIDSSPANAGWGFRPGSETQSYTPPSATFEGRDGEVIHRAAGGRGKVKFNIQHNQPVLCEFEFGGPMVTSNDAIPTGGFMSGITLPAAAPAMAKRFPTLFAAYSPVFTQLDIDVNNTLAKRPTVNDDCVSESGYKPTRISDREIAVTCDPEHAPIATKHWYNEAISGAVSSMYVRCGAFGHVAGTIVFIGPALQITGDVGDGDRDGMTIDNLQMRLCTAGGDDDELVIAHVFI